MSSKYCFALTIHTQSSIAALLNRPEFKDPMLSINVPIFSKLVDI